MAKSNKKTNPKETVSAIEPEIIVNDAKPADAPVAASSTPKRGGKTKKSDETGTPAKETKVSSVERTAEEKADPVKEKPKKQSTRKPKAEKTTAEEKKTSTRTKTKAASKTDPAESTPKKRPGRKPSALSTEKICDLLKKKIDKNAVAGIDEKIAVDIVVWGVENEPDRRLYIEIKDKKAEIQPYPYNDKDLMVSIGYGDAVELLNGKLTLKDAVISGKMTVQVAGDNGSILPALKLGSII